MSAPRDNGTWFRQPVLWLCASIFIASIVGCIAMIALASSHADVAIEAAGNSAVNVPSGPRADGGPAPRDAR